MPATQTLATKILLIGILTAAVSCGSKRDTPPRQPGATSAQRQFAKMWQARTISSLPKGTRIYYLPSLSIWYNGVGASFPGDAIVEKNATSLIVKEPGRKAIVFPLSAQVNYQPRGASAFVAPGRPVPDFLKNRKPDEVAH